MTSIESEEKLKPLLTDEFLSEQSINLYSPLVLDVCCGSRMFWFDKNDSRCLFVDIRSVTHQIDIGTPGTKGRNPIVVKPNILADFTALPFKDESFWHVVFDPPQIERKEAKGLLTKKYGHLNGDWREMLRRGFLECFRVLKNNGTLIFKWAESEYPVNDILRLTTERPMYGHKSGKKSTTHWISFLKSNANHKVNFLCRHQSLLFEKADGGENQ